MELKITLNSEELQQNTTAFDTDSDLNIRSLNSDQGALNGTQEITFHNFFTNNEVDTNGLKTLLHLLICQHVYENENYAPFLSNAGTQATTIEFTLEGTQIEQDRITTNVNASQDNGRKKKEERFK